MKRIREAVPHGFFIAADHSAGVKRILIQPLY